MMAMRHGEPSLVRKKVATYGKGSVRRQAHVGEDDVAPSQAKLEAGAARGTKRSISDIYSGSDIFGDEEAALSSTVSSKMSRPVAALSKPSNGAEAKASPRDASISKYGGRTPQHVDSSWPDSADSRSKPGQTFRSPAEVPKLEAASNSRQASSPAPSTRITSPPIVAQASTSKPRKKVIDTLTAQSSAWRRSTEVPQGGDATHLNEWRDDRSIGGRAASTQASDEIAMAAAARPAKPTAVRFTYGQQRTILADLETNGDPGAGGEDDDELLRKALSQPLEDSTFLDDDADEEDGLAVSDAPIQSVHELRQAGANNRFTDEIHDLMDRIGEASSTPSSLRRNALLELAVKLQDTGFRRQIRDHGVDRRLFRDSGREGDPIAAFAIAAVLVLSLLGPAPPNIADQLNDDGIVGLLVKLLSLDTDISLVARDRKSNLSKMSQKSVADLKSIILSLPDWGASGPPSLSSRTLALKCLQLVTKNSPGARRQTQAMAFAVADNLFEILSHESDELCWDYPAEDRAVDFFLALSAAEALSQGDARWTEEQYSTAADILSTSLKRGRHRSSELHSLVLGLATNATNENISAANVFIEKGVLPPLLDTVSREFRVAVESVTEREFSEDRFRDLLLMLGVLINFAEYPELAQEIFETCAGQEVSPLDTLIGIFLDNYLATSEVRKPWPQMPQAAAGC